METITLKNLYGRLTCARSCIKRDQLDGIDTAMSKGRVIELANLIAAVDPTIRSSTQFTRDMLDVSNVSPDIDEAMEAIDQEYVPLNYRVECERCSAITVIPIDDDVDDCPACGFSLYESPEDEDSVGDIYDNDHGLTIVTETGGWTISDQQARNLMAGLSAMLQHRFTTRGGQSNAR